MSEQFSQLKSILEPAFAQPELLSEKPVIDALIQVLRHIEKGDLRVVSPKGQGPNCRNVPMTGDLREWEVHTWVKQAILLAMRFRTAQTLGSTFNQDMSALQTAEGRVHSGGMLFHDKFDSRRDLAEMKVRVVPPGVIREGAYAAPGVIVMPSFVNIGAWVGEGSMVDTWATVGSCAQVGINVHIAGGVGLGGVLEPANARPVLIGDNAFLGSRAIVVEGAVVSAGAVLGANVCITASTPIYDVTTAAKTEYRGFVPANAVVAPGTRAKLFPGGEVQLQCAYIIAYRSEQTDVKVSLNAVLRETGISV
jgi:2,3,4,5-tetrahydropyridine-2-carboxylate N-succinyltransferase